MIYYFLKDNPLRGTILDDKGVIEEYLIQEKKLPAGEEHPMEVMVLERKVGKIYSVTITVGYEDEQYCKT